MYTRGQLNKYKSGSETEDRIASGQPKDIAAGCTRCVCIHQMAAPFWVKWRHGRHF